MVAESIAGDVQPTLPISNPSSYRLIFTATDNPLAIRAKLVIRRNAPVKYYQSSRQPEA
jgi:hypothetical protein